MTAEKKYRIVAYMRVDTDIQDEQLFDDEDVAIGVAMDMEDMAQGETLYLVEEVEG